MSQNNQPIDLFTVFACSRSFSGVTHLFFTGLLNWDSFLAFTHTLFRDALKDTEMFSVYNRNLAKLPHPLSAKDRFLLCGDIFEMCFFVTNRNLESDLMLLFESNNYRDRVLSDIESYGFLVEKDVINNAD